MYILRGVLGQYKKVVLSELGSALKRSCSGMYFFPPDRKAGIGCSLKDLLRESTRPICLRFDKVSLRQ